MIFRKLNELPIESVSHNPEIKKQIFVCKGEMGNVTQIALVTFQPGQVAEGHKHLDMYEVFLVQKGKGEIKVDEKVAEVQAGDCVVVSPDEMHEVKNNSIEILEIIVIGLEVLD